MKLQGLDTVPVAFHGWGRGYGPTSWFVTVPAGVVSEVEEQDAPGPHFKRCLRAMIRLRKTNPLLPDQRNTSNEPAGCFYFGQRSAWGIQAAEATRVQGHGAGLVSLQTRYPIAGVDRFEDARRALTQLACPAEIERTEFEVVRGIAWRAFGRMVLAGLVAERVFVNGDGEIAFYFFGTVTMPGGGRRRYARLACSMDGVTRMTEDRLTGQVDVTDVHADYHSLDQAIAHIQGFLR